MLLGQNRCRYKHRTLTAFLNHLKSCPDRHFCFAEAHISADQTIHDFRALHIPLGSRYGIQLILGLLVRKHFLKLPLPDSIRSADVSFCFLTCRIQFHQIHRQLFDSAFDLRLCPCPLRPAHLIDLDLFGVLICIFLNHIKVSCQNVQASASAIFNLDIIFGHPVNFNILYTTINADTMSFMNNIITYRQLFETPDTLAIR